MVENIDGLLVGGNISRIGKRSVVDKKKDQWVDGAQKKRDLEVFGPTKHTWVQL